MILLRVLQSVSVMVILMLKLPVYSSFHVAQSQEATNLNFLNSLHALMLEKQCFVNRFFFRHGMIFPALVVESTSINIFKKRLDTVILQSYCENIL